MKKTHIPELDEIATWHFRETQAPTLTISGHHLPLIYKLASTLASPPHNFALVIIDLEGRFDATRLSCSDADSRHIYVHIAAPPPLVRDTDEDEDSDHNVASLVDSASKILLYDRVAASSSGRRWWGTIVIGGFGAGGDVVADRRGWLHVSREQVVEPLAAGLTVQEALGQREARQKAAEEAGWVAESRWGSFTFRE